MRERLRPVGVAAALLVGLSPGLVAGVQQIVAEPRLLYVVVAWTFLVRLTLRAARDPEVRLATAVPWVLAAVTIQLLATAGGFPHLSRFAIPFGVVGFLRGVVGTSLRPALLVFLCIPPPHLVTNLVGVEFARTWSQLAAEIAPRYAGDIVAWDGGLRLAAIAAFTVAYRGLASGALSRGGDPRGVAFSLACAIPLAVVLQILCFAGAGLAPASVATPLFVHGSWIAAFLVFFSLPMPRFEGRPRHGARDAHAH